MLTSRGMTMVQKLQAAVWFQSMGNPLNDDSVIIIDSLAKGIKLFLSYDWDDTLLYARNELSSFLFKHHNKRYQKWNKIVEATDGYFYNDMLKHTKYIVSENEKQERFHVNLMNTLRGACLEAEYSDLNPPLFFNKLVDWYIVGRLPCGIEYYPDGKLKVY